MKKKSLITTSIYDTPVFLQINFDFFCYKFKSVNTGDLQLSPIIDTNLITIGRPKSKDIKIGLNFENNFRDFMGNQFNFSFIKYRITNELFFCLH